ncbi:MAG: ABC transporter transmembrane domain-containing protein [Cytophagales bacterium]|nr:ABC transporter transmembrane domain-containing protein [Cytophagales bacterium]
MTLTNSDKPQKLFVRLFDYYRPHYKIFLTGYLFLILASLCEPLIPSMMKILLDHAGAQAAAVKPTPWPIWAPPLAVIAIFAGRALFGFISSVALGTANNKAVTNLQNDVFKRVLDGDLSLYEQESTSSLISTIRGETQTVGNSFVGVLQDGGRNLLTMIGLTAYLFWLNWQLTLLVLVVMPIIGFSIRKIGQRMRATHFKAQKIAEEVNYVIEENTHAHKLIRLHGAQDAQKSRFRNLLESLRNQTTRALISAAAITPITQIAASFALALILSLALQQNEAGKVTVGDFAAYITAMLMLISPLKGLGDVLPSLHRGSVALKRIFGLIDYPQETHAGKFKAPKVEGKIDFVNVSKTYPNADHPALQNVTLSIQPNQMVALVGASGSGKTTLANLLPSFVRPDGGEVRIDGVAIADWDLRSLRNHIAMVSQDTILLNDTVLANVCIGDEHPNQARAEKALTDAYLWQHIQSMPQGILTGIGHNGHTLSGGQRQRLAIARALYKAAPILILDEATSALDAESEHMVQAAIAKLTQSRTTLVIAHRLSTILHTDSIVVMDKGKIVEQGTYNELIKNNNLFKRLAQQQFLKN